MRLQAEVARLSCKMRREFLKAKKKKEAAAAKAAKDRDPTKEAGRARCKCWLIHNQLLGEDELNLDDESTDDDMETNNEANQDRENDDDDELESFNDPEHCKKHPLYKQNTCRYCFKHKTIYYCSQCSNPKASRKRKEKGPKGGDKHTTAGHMHFCNHGGAMRSTNAGM